MTGRAGVLFAAAVTAAAASQSFAHEFWIEPASFRPSVGSTLAVRLRVGHDFIGDPVPSDPSRIERFVSLGPRGEAPVETQPGAEPAGKAPIDAPGLHLIGYRSLPTPINLAPDAFKAYLREEGLEAVIAAREAAGDSAKRGREIFSRCAKALVSAGKGEARGASRTLGFRLELVPQANPYALAPGAELPVQLLFEGKPLAGALLVAVNKDAPENSLETRSDAAGRVVFRLGRGGAWLIKAVHMVPISTPQADWESLWASLTFELPAARKTKSP